MYVASDRPIGERADDYLTVESLWGSWNSRPIVRHQFSKPYVMCVATHRGCACDFGGGGSDGKRSLDSLGMFLKEQLKTVAELELYSCWMGDEDEPPEQRLKVTPEQLVESFESCVFYRVRRAAEQDDEPVEALI